MKRLRIAIAASALAACAGVGVVEVSARAGADDLTLAQARVLVGDTRTFAAAQALYNHRHGRYAAGAELDARAAGALRRLRAHGAQVDVSEQHVSVTLNVDVRDDVDRYGQPLEDLDATLSFSPGSAHADCGGLTTSQCDRLMAAIRVPERAQRASARPSQKVGS